MKRRHEDTSSPEDASERITLEQLLIYRSLKIAREREEIIESRSLSAKVMLFCGYTTPQIQDRTLQDIHMIKSMIAYNERSESDGLAYSPQKSYENSARN